MPRRLVGGEHPGASRGRWSTRSDDGARGRVPGGHEGRLGQLQRQRVDGASLERVVGDLGQVAAVKQVEDAQVLVERVVRLTGAGQAGDGRDGGLAQRGVVGHGGLADVARHEQAAVPSHGKFGPPAGSCNGDQFASRVTVPSFSGLTQAQVSVLSMDGSVWLYGATRWLDARRERAARWRSRLRSTRR